MHCISRFATFQSNVNQKTISFDAFAQKWDCVVEFLMHCHKTFSKCLYAQDKQKHPWIVLMLLCILFWAFSHFAIVISKTSRRYCANGSTPPTVSDGCWEIVQKCTLFCPSISCSWICSLSFLVAPIRSAKKWFHFMSIFSVKQNTSKHLARQMNWSHLDKEDARIYFSWCDGNVNVRLETWMHK